MNNINQNIQFSIKKIESKEFKSSINDINLELTINKIKNNDAKSLKNRKKEMNELNLMAKEEKKIFDERRDDLIRQIRELEKLPIKRQHGFDPTETPVYGLLEEMSLVELKERLALQKKMLSDEINSKK